MMLTWCYLVRMLRTSSAMVLAHSRLHARTHDYISIIIIVYSSHVPQPTYQHVCTSCLVLASCLHSIVVNGLLFWWCPRRIETPKREQGSTFVLTKTCMAHSRKMIRWAERCNFALLAATLQSFVQCTYAVPAEMLWGLGDDFSPWKCIIACTVWFLRLLLTIKQATCII